MKIILRKYRKELLKKNERVHAMVRAVLFASLLLVCEKFHKDLNAKNNQKKRDNLCTNV